MGISSIMADESRLTGYFCSGTIFNLSNRVFSDHEIKVLEKGLDFAPIQRKINEPELRSDFGDSDVECELSGIFVMNRD